MPLLDHFHNPGKRRLPWATMAPAWGLALIGWLNRHLPRDEFRAETNLRPGPHVEADVAEFREPDVPRNGSRNGAIATLAEAPPAVLTLPAFFPDDLEIEIREEHDRGRLVGVIELVSPANKKEADEREAFVTKCVSYLRKGIGLVVIDVVTERHANLHNDLMRAIGGPSPELLADAPTYVSGYRPVHRRGTGANEIEVWPYPAPVGQPVPAVPFGLRGGPVVVLELETIYTAAVEVTGL
jgi:hypothetical protein